MAQSDDPGELPPLAERRQPIRKRTLLGAFAMSREGMHVVDCTVRDLSPYGARLRVASREVIPANSYLIVPATSTVYEAKVMWIKRDEYGVKLLAAHRADSLKGTKLESLQPFIAAKMTKQSVA